MLIVQVETMLSLPSLLACGEEKKKKRVQILCMPILCIGIPQQALKQSLLLLLPSDRQRH